MAKYTVTFSCGHTEVKELIGKTSTRENTIKYWEQAGICTECWKKQQEAKRAEEVANVVAANLPELTGSEKQINWANKIRESAYTEYQKNGFNYISTETSAAWWIENRNNISSIIYDRYQSKKIDRIKSMSKSEIFKRAHVLAKRMSEQYPDTDYRANFAIALKELYTALKSIKAA